MDEGETTRIQQKIKTLKQSNKKKGKSKKAETTELKTKCQFPKIPTAKTPSRPSINQSICTGIQKSFSLF